MNNRRLVPIFAALMDAPLEERVAAYRDPAWRARAWAELTDPGRGFAPNWQSQSIAESDTRPDLVGRRVLDLAEERGCTPLDVVLEEQAEEELVEAGVEVPIDESQVVADDVLPVVGELDRLPALLAPPLALELPGEDLAREHIEPVKLVHEAGVEQFRTGCRGER